MAYSIRYPSYYDSSIDDATLDPELATHTSDGLMSKEDKIKLDSIGINSKDVFNAKTHYDFPSIGSIDIIYKAYDERKTYQWNNEKLIYEPLDENILTEISLINGGKANVTN